MPPSTGSGASGAERGGVRSEFDGRYDSSSRTRAAAASSSRSTRWQTPLRSWTRGPPSSATPISSPSASRTTPGPVRNIAASSVISSRSVSAGEYAPPPAEVPVTTEICGTIPFNATVSRKIRP